MCPDKASWVLTSNPCGSLSSITIRHPLLSADPESEWEPQTGNPTEQAVGEERQRRCGAGRRSTLGGWCERLPGSLIFHLGREIQTNNSWGSTQHSLWRDRPVYGVPSLSVRYWAFRFLLEICKLKIYIFFFFNLHFLEMCPTYWFKQIKHLHIYEIFVGAVWNLQVCLILLIARAPPLY